MFKYLLRNLKVEGPSHVWAMDITYIPVKGGYLYLCAIIDLYSRYVVGWSLSSRRALETAVMEHGTPGILKTDQGSKFTAKEFHSWVTAPERGIRLSMDRNGRAIDNVFIERLWRSVKYEHLYLFLADDSLECHRRLRNYFEYYNNGRRHQGIYGQRPISRYQQKKAY